MSERKELYLPEYLTGFQRNYIGYVAAKAVISNRAQTKWIGAYKVEDRKQLMKIDHVIFKYDVTNGTHGATPNFAQIKYEDAGMTALQSISLELGKDLEEENREGEDAETFLIKSGDEIGRETDEVAADYLARLILLDEAGELTFMDEAPKGYVKVSFADFSR